MEPATVTDDVNTAGILRQDDPAAVAHDLQHTVIRMHLNDESITVESLDTIDVGLTKRMLAMSRRIAVNLPFLPLQIRLLVGAGDRH